jgi:hypothetical protein
MGGEMIESAGTLELLTSRVDELERRIHALEALSNLAAPRQRSDLDVNGRIPDALKIEAAQEPAAKVPVTAREAHAVEEPSTEQVGEQAGGVFPVLGKAVFGIAGAYLLRALAESAALSRQAIAGVAIVYALGWLVGAARASATRKLAGTIYAATSAMILAPMLWELTLHFDVLPATLTAVVLGCFVAVATVLSWKNAQSPVLWVAYGAASLTALALSVASRQMIPFVALLLTMAILCEYVSRRNLGRTIRVLVVGAADATLAAMLFVYNGPAGARADYPTLGTIALVVPACILFLTSSVSIGLQTVALKETIGSFDALQAMVAFLLAACSLVFFLPGSGTLMLGIACLILAVLCYAASLGLFRNSSLKRNFHVYAAWSAGLLLTGSFCTLPPEWNSAVLAIAALAAIVFGDRIGCIALEFHGVMFIVIASLNEMLNYAVQALAGEMPFRPTLSVLVVSACAMLCYIAGKERVGEAWQQQILHLVPALLGVFAAAALLAQGIVRLVSLGMTLDVFHVALIRSLTVCSIALGLAWGGSRWERLEMTRIAYAALAFMGAKLLFEDLRLGHMEFIAASLILFAMTLIGVPRLARTGRRKA